jgi:copper chaperone CopZ
MTKKIYKVDGMHCTSCALVIESDLEDAGVKAVCSYAKQTVEAEFDEKKTSEKIIHEVVKKAGYTLVSS